MKKVLLAAIFTFIFFCSFSQDSKSEVAQNLLGIAALAWPMVALVLIIVLYPHAKNILRSHKLILKIAGMELTAEQATTQMSKHILDLETKLLQLRCEIDELNHKEVIVKPGMKTENWRLIWVTENHANHAFEIAFLEQDGIEVTKATTTKEVMEILKEEEASIDAIITGVSRKENNIENPKAGFELLRMVKNKGYEVEVFVMCSPDNIKQYYQQLMEAGAKQATSSPLSLFRYLKEAGLNCPLLQKGIIKTNRAPAASLSQVFSEEIK